MKFLSGLVAAATLGALFSTGAQAAREIPAACQRDAAALCPGMVPGDHKLGKCMKSHEGQVSSGCKEAARAMRHEHEAAKGKGSTGDQAGVLTPSPSR